MDISFSYGGGNPDAIELTSELPAICGYHSKRSFLFVFDMIYFFSLLSDKTSKESNDEREVEVKEMLLMYCLCKVCAEFQHLFAEFVTRSVSKSGYLVPVQ